jgi:hypothetical protein
MRRIFIIFVLALTSLFVVSAVTGRTDRLAAGPGAQEDFQRFLNSIWVHDGVAHENMVVFPVTLREAGDPTAYISLDEALENGFVTISEVGSGSVPTLRLEVKSTKPMFFMGGEVVTGAKQDRILSHDLLFRDVTGVFDLPVYCVEQGRWTSVSDKFGSGQVVGSINVRKSAVMQEGQSRVWDEVRDQNAKMAAETSTGTLQASYDSDSFKEKSTGYMEKFIDIPALHGGKVVGAVVAVDGKVVSADLFCNPETFRKLWSKVLKAAVMEAVTAGKGTIGDNAPAREFLGAALKATIARQPNPSKGEEYSLTSENVQGSFILAHEGVVHMALFSGTLKKAEPEVLREPQIQQQIQQNPQIQRQIPHR